MDRGKILAMLHDNTSAFKRYGVSRIGLFGSYSSNTQSDTSDVDILVHFEAGKKSFDNYMDLKFFLEERFGCQIDLVIDETIKPSLKKHILETVEYAS